MFFSPSLGNGNPIFTLPPVSPSESRKGLRYTDLSTPTKLGTSSSSSRRRLRIKHGGDSKQSPAPLTYVPPFSPESVATSRQQLVRAKSESKLGLYSLDHDGDSGQENALPVGFVDTFEYPVKKDNVKKQKTELSILEQYKYCPTWATKYPRPRIFPPQLLPKVGPPPVIKLRNWLQKYYEEKGPPPPPRIVQKIIIRNTLREKFIEVCAEGDLDTLKQFVKKNRVSKNVIEEARDEDGRTALIISAVCDNFAMTKYLIRKGASVTATDDTGWTALTWSVRQGNVPMCKLLIRKGVPIDTSDLFGHRPLMYAVYYKNYALIELLVESGVLVDQNWLKTVTPDIKKAVTRGRNKIQKALDLEKQRLDKERLESLITSGANGGGTESSSSSSLSPGGAEGKTKKLKGLAFMAAQLEANAEKHKHRTKVPYYQAEEEAKRLKMQCDEANILKQMQEKHAQFCPLHYGDNQACDFFQMDPFDMGD